MTGYSIYICPICGKDWRSVSNFDSVYVFSHCLCEETIAPKHKL